jgi:hypothetical protein
MRDYEFEVTEPAMTGAGWWFTVVTESPRRHGPFATEQDARSAREGLFHRWNAQARSRGGWAWKSTHVRWHLTLPDEVSVRGRRMRSAPVAVHQPLPSPPEDG